MDSRKGMVELEITTELTPEMAAVVETGLSDYNRGKIVYVDARDLPVVFRQAATGKVQGGLLGRTTLGLLFIDLVYLPEEARGRGVGARMLKMAEEEAVARGCTAAVLFTIISQAPEFYERHGYRELGCVF